MKNLAALAAAALLAAPALADDLLNFDDLPEGFLGTSFSYHGITFHDANNVGGSFPSGETFTPQDIGDNLIIENSTYLFDNFSNWGSRPNTLTFGNAYIPGPNLSIGPLARVTLDLPERTSRASVEIAFYENGPWGGIVLHLDAIRDGQVVSSQSLTIADGGGRDNVTVDGLAALDDEMGFTSLRLYATWGDGYSAPRVLVDNVTLTTYVPPCPADYNHDGFVDFFDYIEYTRCFELGECSTGSADFNNDGFVDFFDYADYVAAFETGC